MDRRFTALRVIGTIFKVLAWISLILGILLAVLTLVLGFTIGISIDFLDAELANALIGIAGFVAILILALLLYLALYAAGEYLFLLLALEENSRRVAYILQQQYTATQPAYGLSPTDMTEEQSS